MVVSTTKRGDNNSIPLNRFLYFLIGCIGLRFVLVYLAKNSSLEVLRWMGYIALVIATGFLYIYLTDSRKTGIEVFGAKEGIWWNQLRPVHAGLYIVFAVYAIKQQQNIAYIPLLIDVILGLGAWTWFHFYRTN